MKTRFWFVPAIFAYTLNVSAKADNAAKLPAKLERIIIPSVNLETITAAEAVTWLEAQSKQLDPDKVGVSIKLSGVQDDWRIKMNSEKVSVADLIRTLARHFDREILIKDDYIQLKSFLTKPRVLAPVDRSVKLPEKAERLIIPRLVFQEVTAAEAFAFIEKKTKELDPDGVGIPMKLTGPADEVSNTSLSVANIPVSELVRALAKTFEREIIVKDGTIEFKAKFTEPRVHPKGPPPPPTIPGLEPIPN